MDKEAKQTISEHTLESVDTKAWHGESSKTLGSRLTRPFQRKQMSSRMNRITQSFRRQDAVEYADVDLSMMDEQQRRNYVLANQPLQKTLSQRHLMMIAIGGTLGTGLFIGIGYSLSSGPGSLLIGFLIVGLMMFCVVQSAAELACQYPVSGSYAVHVSRFMEPSIGFTVATNYALAWLISFPSELIGCAMTLQYWNKSVNPAVWVAIFYVFIMSLNMFGVRSYGEAEFWMSLFKVVAIVIFIIIGIVLICGGGPNSTGYIGTKYWHDPGSFAKPVFKGLCNTFVSAAFSFGGAELVVLTASESRKVESVSRAAKGTFWRIAIFYITTVIVIGCLVPYTNEQLLGGDNDEDITASPFVIALSGQGSMGTKASHFMNTVILIAVLSVCNSAVYASSRIIQALGVCGQLPKICGYVDQKGRPLVGIAICGVFGLLGFLVASDNEGDVFTWLFALCSISSFFTWFCICASQVRFRFALRAQGRSSDEIAHKSMLGIYGGFLGCLLNALLIAGEIYVSIFPLGGDPSAKQFFQYCLSIPIMIAVYIGHKLFANKSKRVLIPAQEIDLETGRKIKDLEQFKHEVLEDKEKLASKPLYYRIYRFWC
ncbi:bifunctional polyamine/amino acid permease SAM3 [Lachancea thermotolerans CBS 6340]|uniref:KLTH0C08052p n=1 Tax=Lachancea thermotolerans (strain ATCC 56472 / CBS 6340 / NRRL Y-8284) TaxID=559295 RepID=C5DEC4_LACTC|nr:KLTH0C08052p [Lachancea thermotolerans CBS 6340]CAR22135.1 KLTH0C08052p [Lachancea thermotolerans CBS 6340]